MTNSLDKPVIIEGKEDTPSFLLDKKNRLFRVEGSSFPEDAKAVYKPAVDWLTENARDLDGLVCVFDYKILSSASNKMVYEIMLILENMYKNGINVKVRWLYFDFDEDMLAEGKSFMDSFKIPFELVKK